MADLPKEVATEADSWQRTAQAILDGRERERLAELGMPLDPAPKGATDGE